MWTHSQGSDYNIKDYTKFKMKEKNSTNVSHFYWYLLNWALDTEHLNFHQVFSSMLEKYLKLLIEDQQKSYKIYINLS